MSLQYLLQCALLTAFCQNTHRYYTLDSAFYQLIDWFIHWLIDWLTDWLTTSLTHSLTKCIHSLTEDIVTVSVWHFTNQMAILCMHFICKTVLLNFQWVFLLVYKLKHLFSAIPRMHLPILLVCFSFCCLSCLLPLFWVL